MRSVEPPTLTNETGFRSKPRPALDRARQSLGRSRLSGLLLAGAVLLLAGLETRSLANVIQANRTYPPPNGSFRTQGVAYDFGPGVVLTNVAFTFFDTFAPDPPGPANLTHSFNAQCSYFISTDGGVTYSGEQAATANFTVTLGPPGGITGNDYPFNIASLIISGGDLPAGFVLTLWTNAAPPPPTAVVTFTPNTPQTGLFSIDNTFYLPLQLSQDSGVSFTPNTLTSPPFDLEPLTSEEVSHSPTLPPGDGQYHDAADYHAKFASGIIIRNPLHDGFLGHGCGGTNGTGGGDTNSLCPPPLVNNSVVENFDSLMHFDLDPGTSVGPIEASVSTSVYHLQDSAGMEIYQTSMLQLDPAPGTSLPPGMNFRINPDPTKPSQGITTIRHLNATDNAISSAFALRLQLTTDNGVTWQDSDQFARMRLEIVPLAPPALILNGFTRPSGVPTFTFATGRGFKYRMVYSDTVTNRLANWLPVIDAPNYAAPDGWSLTSVGANMTVKDHGTTGHSHRYYRIEATP